MNDYSLYTCIAKHEWIPPLQNIWVNICITISVDVHQRKENDVDDNDVDNRN